MKYVLSVQYSCAVVSVFWLWQEIVLKNTRCAWAGATFLTSCADVSIFQLRRETVLGVPYLPYQLCRCVFLFIAAGNSFGLHRSVFWLWQEIVLGVTYLPTIPVVPLCQFFCRRGK